MALRAGTPGFPCPCLHFFACFFGALVVFWLGALVVFSPELALRCSLVWGASLRFEQMLVMSP